MAFASGASKTTLLLLALAGCSPAGASSSIQLEAELTSDDVTLRWHGNDTATVVEFATEPDGRYTILQFSQRDLRNYEHPDLMPDTTFYYRVRAVDGPVTRPSEATTTAHGITGEDWLAPRTMPDDRAQPKPGGAPGNLLAQRVGADGVLLTWTDNATDETGFLIEADAGDGFEVVFVVDPDINSAGLITDGPARYRVRAYHFGASSNVVSERTR